MCLGTDRTLCDRLASTVNTASWLVGFVGFCDSFVASIERPRTCRPTWLVVCCLSHNFGFTDGLYLVQQVTGSSRYLWLEVGECTAA